MTNNGPLISIIIPVRNGDRWIKRCFDGIFNQTALGVLPLEICVCNDGSTDDTMPLLNSMMNVCSKVGIPMRIQDNAASVPGGVGFAKNCAVSLSSGQYLCFQDIDDVMLPDRIARQYQEALNHSSNALIGCQFKREPDSSTPRFTNWANSLTERQLDYQIYTSNGPTVIMPTWFCHRSVFDRVGGFESGPGIPEDLIFFYKHLDFGGAIARVDDCLLVYTYHPSQTTFQINQKMIWKLRLQRLEAAVLSAWPKFTIWNAGKQGRKLYNSLSEQSRGKVEAFCDVDENKIGKAYQCYDPVERKARANVKIVRFTDADPPLVICVKMDLTNGAFESNLKGLNLKEGLDYVMFS